MLVVKMYSARSQENATFFFSQMGTAERVGFEPCTMVDSTQLIDSRKRQKTLKTVKTPV